jgi:prevent-host-death family protein
MSNGPTLRIFVMNPTYSISDAQSQLPRLIREAERSGAVTINRHGDTVAYLVSRDRMEAIVETMEILSNPRAMTAIADHRSGKLRFKPLSSLAGDK